MNYGVIKTVCVVAGAGLSIVGAVAGSKDADEKAKKHMDKLFNERFGTDDSLESNQEQA